MRAGSYWYVWRRYTIDGTIFEIVLYPLIAVSALTIAGQLASSVLCAATGGPIPGFWSTYYLLLTAWMSRICLLSGLSTGLLSAIGYNWALLPPFFEFQPISRAEIMVGVGMLIAILVFGRQREEVYSHAATPIKRGEPLPFCRAVCCGGERLGSCWNVEPTGNWAIDQRIGLEYGRLYVDCVRSGGNPYPLLAWVMRDMALSGRWTGIEAGFCSVVERAMLNRPQVFANKPDLAADHHAGDADGDGVVIGGDDGVTPRPIR